MTTSGTATFTVSRNDIFDTALTLAGLIKDGVQPTGDQYARCSLMLNLMVKAWMARGINLWAKKEATLFLGVGTASYSLGPTGTHCTNSYVQTTLSTAEATSSTSLGITSATGMSASDNIGIVLDDGTIHWTTISGAPGTTTTIATGLASAAAAGNVVFAYTTKVNRPQRIFSAYRRSISSYDTPIEVVSRIDYSRLANKATTGKTIEVFYDPQLTTGVLKAWPAPDLATDVIRFWYSRIIEDFNAAADNADFPIEWGEALIYGLADRVCGLYQGAASTRVALRAEAAEKLELASGYDSEPSSVFFQPDFR